MRTVHATLLTLGLVALVAAPAAAQGQGRGLFGGGGTTPACSATTACRRSSSSTTSRSRRPRHSPRRPARRCARRSRSLQDLEGAGTSHQDGGDHARGQRLVAQGRRRVPQARADHPPQADRQPGARGAGLRRPRGRRRSSTSPTPRRPTSKTIQRRPGRRCGRIFQEFQDDREGAMKKMAELRKTDAHQDRGEAQRRAAEDLEGDCSAPRSRSSTSRTDDGDPPDVIERAGSG